MRTITKNVYELKELGDKAREKALNEVRNKCSYELTEGDMDQIRAEIDSLCVLLGAEPRYRGEHLSLRLAYPYSELEDMEDGLMRFIKRHGSEVPKEYRGSHGMRLSNIIYDNFLSQIEWCYISNTVDQIWSERYEYVRRGASVNEFLDDMADAITRFANDCIEDCYSDDFVSGFIECNEMEFYEDGTPY